MNPLDILNAVISQYNTGQATAQEVQQAQNDYALEMAKINAGTSNSNKFIAIAGLGIAVYLLTHLSRR